MKANKYIITAVLALASHVVAAKEHGLMHNKEAAIAACQNKAEGTNVTVEHPKFGPINAICAKTPKNNQITAVPTKMYEHMKQAQAACVGKTEGDKVMVNDMRHTGQTIEATCTKRGDILVAHPKRKLFGWHHNKEANQQPKM